jgi:hypothetical protein
MKKIIILLLMICSLSFIKNAEAGTLSWKNSQKLSANTFEFYLEVTDLNLNYVSGTWEIENGKILEIKMNDGWINKKGNNNSFYYYHNGIKTGNYRIATIVIELTKDGFTKINNIDMGINTCTKDLESNYFDKQGNLTNEQNYKETCLNNDASLKDLIISKGELSPSFQSNIDSYQVTVEQEVTEMTFTPTLNHSNARVISKTTCPLNIGENTCKIIIEAESGLQKTYFIHVTRKSPTSSTLSSDATLKSLTINHGSLFPNFNPDIENYTIKVGYDITEINWHATLNNPNAKILSEHKCQLNVGENTCNIIIEAENKEQKNYRLLITREEVETEETLNKNISIKDFSIENGELIETFIKDKTNYTLKINEQSEAIIFRYTMEANNLSYTIPFKINSNTKFLDLEIKSLDGQNKITYHFNLIRAQEEKNEENDSYPNHSKNEIENPETGIAFKISQLIIIITLFIIGIICIKKKNIISKI